MTSTFKTQAHIMRALTVMLLAAFLLAVAAVAAPVSTVEALGCGSWIYDGCCDSWWPGLQNHYHRWCQEYPFPPYTEDYCSPISVCG